MNPRKRLSMPTLDHLHNPILPQMGTPDSNVYDKITHEFLWATLQKFDFPIHFINTVKYLYASAETHVIINGEISSPFRVCCGVQQGDPLSCLLFNLAI
jgi:Reverse transcriptase (RNA-dependent DNA polymerase)